MAGEKRIREREGEGNNRRFWRQSKWFREKISPHVKLGNISWGMPALNFLASNRTREYSRTLGVVSFFFKWTRERRGANSDPISRFNIPSSRRRFHRNRGTGKLPFYLYRFNAFTGDGNHATVNNVFLSNYPIANRAAPRRSGYALFPINGDSFAISTPRSRKWNTSRWKSSYFFWKCEQSSLLSQSDRKVYERYRIRKIILVEITISRIIAERTINDPTNS